jgi:dihydropteroate synthase
MKSSSGKIVEWAAGSLDFSAGCVVMGVLNVTPDSFSDGGEFLQADKAIEHGMKMADDGAAIIDVGGESSRPGSKGVSADEQIKRVVPVIEGLGKKIDVPISTDTYNVEVAKAALEAGAGKTILQLWAMNEWASWLLSGACRLF